MTTVLTLVTAGSDSGPFDLYSNINGYGNPFEVGVPKASLVNGYTTTKVPDYTDVVRVKSTGVCTSETDISLYYPPLGGGTLRINVPGVGNNIAPSSPGSNPLNGYTLNSSITCVNIHPTLVVRFSKASLSPPYSINTTNGAARILNFTGGISCNLNTAPQEGQIINPNLTGGFVSFGKSGFNNGYVILSLETYNATGVKEQVFWTFNI